MQKEHNWIVIWTNQLKKTFEHNRGNGNMDWVLDDSTKLL